MNRILDLYNAGQSIWYDNVSRHLLETDCLKKMIAHQHIFGVTSNPSIFEKAIAQSHDYDELIRDFAAKNPDASTNDLYLSLVIPDIQDTADLLKGVYDETNKKDGYVSIEVSPAISYDTQAIIEEARFLFQKVNRPNVMIKIPATHEGIEALTVVISEGINVNVTLLFDVEMYEKVAQAYIKGLKILKEKGGDVSSVASVASFFLSRIDVLVDEKLPADSPLRGKISIGNAKKAYQIYQKIFEKNDFIDGAQKQRVLWASTGTKNPKYPDTLYVDSLIGPNTVNTVPPSTLAAFEKHGHMAPKLMEGWDQLDSQFSDLKAAGVDLKKITDHLLKEGIEKFEKSFNTLFDAIEEKKKSLG